MSEWQPIETARRQAGVEIIGTCWSKNVNGTMECIREPFISFWSPSLNKFYASPTHWTDFPTPPDTEQVAAGPQNPSGYGTEPD